MGRNIFLFIMTKLLSAQQFISVLDEMKSKYGFYLIGIGGQYDYDSEDKTIESYDCRYTFDILHDKWDGFAIHKQYIFGWEKDWFGSNEIPKHVIERIESGVFDIDEDATMCLIVLSEDTYFERRTELN